MGSPIWNHKNSLHVAGMLILFESLHGILLPDHRFSFHHFVPQVCQSIWQFEKSSALLWKARYFEKDYLHAHFVSSFSFLMPFSHESEHAKHMTSLIQLVFGSFLPAIASIGRPKQIPRRPLFFEQLAVPCSVGFICLILCKASSLIFCVWLWPHQLLRTICFLMFALPAAWPVLHMALLYPPLPVSSA